MSTQNTRTIVTGTIGTIIEWAEYAFYGYMAVPMARYFFPDTDHTANLLAAFAVFAAGFIMRPIGAVIFGHIGDKIGRKLALLISMLLMGIATLAIGCLPTYQQIGLWAPALLLLCRLLQGLAVSSECLGAAVFLIEHAGKRFPNLAGSWPGFAAALGMTLGGIAATLVTHPAAPEWAWRCPFFVGAFGCAVALYLRQRVQESPEFLAAKAANQLTALPIQQLWQGYSLAIARVAAFAVFTGGMIYVGNMYFATFLTQYAGYSHHDATLITTLGEFLVVLLFPVVAWCADKTNGVMIMRVGLALVMVVAPLMFYLANTGNIMLILLAQFLYAMTDALITAPMFKYLFDQFPTAIRVTGIAVSWNIAIALLGGTAPMIAQISTQQFNLMIGPGLYIALAALCVWWVMSLRPSSDAVHQQPEHSAAVPLEAADY